MFHRWRRLYCAPCVATFTDSSAAARSMLSHQARARRHGSAQLNAKPHCPHSPRVILTSDSGGHGCIVRPLPLENKVEVLKRAPCSRIMPFVPTATVQCTYSMLQPSSLHITTSSRVASRMRLHLPCQHATAAYMSALRPSPGHKCYRNIVLAVETVHVRMPVKCSCAIEESMILCCKSKQAAHQSQ